MEFKKDRSRILLLASIFLFLGILVQSYILYRGGFSDKTVEVSLYFLPITLLLIYFSVSIYRISCKKIVLDEEGLIVQDFCNDKIPWGHIKNASVKSQYIPRGGSACWLIIKTKNDAQYASSKINKLNKSLLGINGIPVCNLSAYKYPSVVLNEIQKRL